MTSSPEQAKRNLEVKALAHEGMAHEHRKSETAHRLQAEAHESKAATCRELMAGIAINDTITP